MSRVLFYDWLSKHLRSEVLWIALRQGLDLAVGLPCRLHGHLLFGGVYGLADM